MDAEYYNKVRRIIFSTIHDRTKGFSAAYDYMLQTYKDKLSPASYAGLMAEIKFYEAHQSALKLTVAADTGEHADFSGVFDGKAARFDVTTNLDYKKFEEYEPYMGHGIEYKIAHFDRSSFELIDIFALKFERCSCGGYRLPFILMKNQNHNRHGEPLLNNDQVLIKLCSECANWNEEHRWTNSFCPSPSEFADGLFDDDDDDDESARGQAELDSYKIDMYKTFRREFSDDVMAIAEHNYKVLERDGGGIWTFDFLFKNMAVSDLFPELLDVGLFE